jgi:hypothetical protein
MEMLLFGWVGIARNLFAMKNDSDKPLHAKDESGRESGDYQWQKRRKRTAFVRL